MTPEDKGLKNCRVKFWLKQNTYIVINILAQMDRGKVLVRNVIGQVEEISDKDIENALWNYYYNTEDTIAYLLGMLVFCEIFIDID
jgi:hypothetical protein